MPKVSKWLKRETPLLWRYGKEVLEHKRAIFGSGAVITILWLTGHYGADLLGKLIPHLPVALLPWLTPHKLIAASFLFVLFWAQYLAWRTLRLKLDGPEIDKRLSVSAMEPGMVIKEPHQRQQLEAEAGKPLPDHCLDLKIWNKEEIRPAGIVVECTAPIYYAYCQRQFFSGKETGMSWRHERPPVYLKTDCVLFKFFPNVLSKETAFRFGLYSPQPISIKRMSIATREEMEHF